MTQENNHHRASSINHRSITIGPKSFLLSWRIFGVLVLGLIASPLLGDVHLKFYKRNQTGQEDHWDLYCSPKFRSGVIDQKERIIVDLEKRLIFSWQDGRRFYRKETYTEYAKRIAALSKAQTDELGVRYTRPIWTKAVSSTIGKSQQFNGKTASPIDLFDPKKLKIVRIWAVKIDPSLKKAIINLIDLDLQTSLPIAAGIIFDDPNERLIVENEYAPIQPDLALPGYRIETVELVPENRRRYQIPKDMVPVSPSDYYREVSNELIDKVFPKNAKNKKRR